MHQKNFNRIADFASAGPILADDDAEANGAS